MRRTLAWGLLGNLVLLAFWFRPDPPRPAWAQGVGIFSRASCSQINSPVATQTFCFDTTRNQLLAWTGTLWTPISFQPSLGGTGGTQNTWLLQPPANVANANNASLVMVPSATTNSGQINSQIVLYNRPGGERYTVTWFNGNLFVQSDTSGVGSVTPIQHLMGNSGTCTMMENTQGFLGVGPSACTSDVNVTTELHVQRATQVNRELLRLTQDMTANAQGQLFFENTAGGGQNYGMGQIAAPSEFDLRQLPGGTYVLRALASGSVFFPGGSIQAGVSAPGDQGPGTINITSGLFTNNLSVLTATGTGANLTHLTSISGTSTFGANLRGTCTFAAGGTCTVTFGTTEPSAAYFVATGCPVLVSGKTVTGFTMTATTSNSNACDWIMMR